MLKVLETASLPQRPQYSPHGVYAYVEASFSNEASHPVDYDWNTASLPEKDVEDWVWQKGTYAPSQAAQQRGGFRILFAQSTSGFARGVPTTLHNARVLEGLDLPSCSLCSFQQTAGVFSLHSLPMSRSGSNGSRLGLVFRTPQKKKCSMGLFAISYDFSTGSVTALNLSYAFDLEQFGTLPSNALRQFVDQLQGSRAQWSHPLFLPCIFLVAHAARVKSYVNGTIGSEIAIVKDCVGVTRAGTSQKAFLTQTYAAGEAKQPKLFVDGRLQRQDARRLTERINDLSTAIIYAKRSPLWDMQVAKFLLDILDRDEKVRKSDEATSKMLKETLEYVSNFSEGCLEEAESAEAQMKLQLDILYTSIAQDDGQTSARLAASAGRDSTSMKIVALIAAAYLPGTFVATLLSMDMFKWQFPASDDSAGVNRASPDFWIYWAITIPLTIVTISGWAIWWKFEKYRFDRDVRRTADI